MERNIGLTPDRSDQTISGEHVACDLISRDYDWTYNSYTGHSVVVCYNTVHIVLSNLQPYCRLLSQSWGSGVVSNTPWSNHNTKSMVYRITSSLDEASPADHRDTCKELGQIATMCVHSKTLSVLILRRSRKHSNMILTHMNGMFFLEELFSDVKSRPLGVMLAQV